jgi:hypothetical protein
VSKLRFRDRLRARNAARDLWVSRRSDPTIADMLSKAIDGDEDAGEQLLASHPELVGIDPATLLLLIQVAIKLWIWWQSNKVEDPSEAVAEGEPIGTSDDE